ncbi:MAG TPA: flagellar hook-basal body complex protein FliE [Deltaproteobacteria bacterium]|nr:flagellar hook-basal body complex protein FliE [Deltaproteobacteria bacterium]
MRVTSPDFGSHGPGLNRPQEGRKPGLDFVETLKEAVDSANSLARQSEQAALDLSSGRAPNIHETMIAMQKADIALRLVVNVTNKLLEGYRELTNLR